MSKLGGCGKFIKYSIFLVNFIIFLGGLVVVGLGIWVLAGGAEVKDVLGNSLLTSSATILLTIGSLVALISFLGCCGAIKEVRCLLLTFFIILLLITILIIAGIIVAIKLKDSAKNVFEDALTETMKKYDKNNNVKKGWDSIQEKMECCGVKSWQDWGTHKLEVPASCQCKVKEKCITILNYWNKGCCDEIIEEIKKYSKPLIISGAFLAVIIVLSMVFSCTFFILLK